MTKKQIVTASTAAALLLASATLAFAQTASTTTTATTAATSTIATPPTPSGVGAPTESVGAAPMPAAMTAIPMRKDAKNMVQIGPEGNALIHGTISAVGTNSITVNSWGGVWTINVNTETKVTPKSTSTPLAWIKQGDFVGVNGKIDTTQPWTVNAQAVRDTDAEQRTTMMQKQMKDAQQKMRKDIKQIKKTGKEEIKNLRQKQEEERKKLKGQ